MVCIRWISLRHRVLAASLEIGSMLQSIMTAGHRLMRTEVGRSTVRKYRDWHTETGNISRLSPIIFAEAESVLSG